GVRGISEESERERNLVAARRAERFELLNMCDLWCQQLDPNRHHDDERAALADYMDSLRSLTFRIEALGDARDRYAGGQLIATPAANCCKLSLDALETTRRMIGGTTRAASIDVLATEDEFRAVLEPEHHRAHAETGISDSFREALTLTGYYCALADAVGECQQRAKAIDWRGWEAARF
ncbi:MAG: hypothetical protein AAF637_14710, partial [Pseudomonadota bacterium]